MATKRKAIRATPKQQQAIQGVIIDKKSVRRAMIDAGYSINTADNPKVLTTSAAWVETMDKLGLDDVSLATRHTQLMNSENEQVAMKAVDTAYKVKGRYDTSRNSNTFNAPVLIQITPPQVEDTAETKDI